MYETDKSQPHQQGEINITNLNDYLHTCSVYYLKKKQLNFPHTHAKLRHIMKIHSFDEFNNRIDKKRMSVNINSFKLVEQTF